MSIRFLELAEISTGRRVPIKVEKIIDLIEKKADWEIVYDKNEPFIRKIMWGILGSLSEIAKPKYKKVLLGKVEDSDELRQEVKDSFEEVKSYLESLKEKVYERIETLKIDRSISLVRSDKLRTIRKFAESFVQNIDAIDSLTDEIGDVDTISLAYLHDRLAKKMPKFAIACAFIEKLLTQEGG